jgi:hydrogenase nickel incorporation protein HypA/HybF
MHEMPFTQAILEMAEKAAEGKPITRIHLRVGWLSAIVPESVQVFFDFLSRDTPAKGAELVFEIAPITLSCRNCGRTAELAHDAAVNPRQALAQAFRAGCPCGRGELKVTGGLDFDMTGIDVDD